MRWNWRDWGVGLIVVVMAIAVGLPAGPLELIVLCPGVPRATVEKVLGPGEALPPTQFYYISIINAEAVREQMLENMHTESCRYSHPLGMITIEYRGYRDQHVKNADFVPEWRRAGVAHLSIVPLTLVVGAAASRVLRHKLSTVPTSPPPA